MSTQVQFRRGTTTQNNAFTGAAGEISVDTDLKTIRLHDGTTAGGGSTMLNNTSTQTALNKTFSTGSVWQGTAVGLAYGGTGSSLTAVAGAIAYSSANGLGLTAAGTSGQILVSGGVNSPTWVAASSISAGSATLATTATNIAGGSAGQLIIQADTGLSTFITAGASGTFLRSAGAGYAPTWATADITIGSTVIDLGSSTSTLNGLNILAATGTSHWTLPVGTTGQRPVSPAIGMVRYNATQSTFEGYSSGAWSSLGGVKSVDALTYIQAETSAGASNGDLDFFAEDSAGTASTQIGQWNRTNLKDYTGTLVGTQTTQNVFNTTATTVNAFGAATTIEIGAATGTTNINNNLVVDLDLQVKGGDITTDQTTFNLINTTATTVNAFGAATTLTLGATSGTTTVRNNLVVTGDLTIDGTTTTVNAVTITVDDKNIELGSVATPTNTTADGGGITLKGTTDKTFNWINATGAWTSSEHLELAAGKTLVVGGSTSGTTTVTASAAASGTLTLPAATDQLVGRATTDTLTNKTLTAPNIATIVNSGTLTLPTSTDTLVGRATTDTLTNKTLTAPVIATIVNTGTLSLPTSTDTLVGRATTDTLTNKTMSGASNTFTNIPNSALSNSTISGVALGDTLATFTTNVSGTGLSGSASYNGSGAATFTVSSNATNANTASTIVARDGSGNFSAGTITATLTGTANNIRDYTINQNVGTGNNPTFAGVVISAGSSLVSGHGAWTGEQNKIQWHSSHLYFQNTDSGRLAVFRRSNGAEPCQIDNNGNLTAASLQSTSDIKLKENVVTISNPSEIINGLRGVTFDWKATKKKSYGLIAQEVEVVLPELVNEVTDDSLNPDSETTKTVDYDKIVSVLIEGWKEQQSQIKTLQDEVATLKAKLGE